MGLGWGRMLGVAGVWLWGWDWDRLLKAVAVVWLWGWGWDWLLKAVDGVWLWGWDGLLKAVAGVWLWGWDWDGFLKAVVGVWLSDGDRFLKAVAGLWLWGWGWDGLLKAGLLQPLPFPRGVVEKSTTAKPDPRPGRKQFNYIETAQNSMHNCWHIIAFGKVTHGETDIQENDEKLRTYRNVSCFRLRSRYCKCERRRSRLRVYMYTGIYYVH